MYDEDSQVLGTTLIDLGHFGHRGRLLHRSDSGCWGRAGISRRGISGRALEAPRICRHFCTKPASACRRGHPGLVFLFAISALALLALLDVLEGWHDDRRRIAIASFIVLLISLLAFIIAYS